MPRYYFDVHDGIQIIDELGQDLIGDEAAKAEAFRIASGFAIRPAMLGEDGGAIIIVIRDAPDSTVLTVRLVFNIEAAKERRLHLV